MDQAEDFIIGIGGLPRSGKDSLADILMERGYFGVSFGDITRSFARERHQDKPDPISVANMTETSNWLRETRGPDVILNEALNLYHEAKKDIPYKGAVFYSVRAPVEVDFILQHGGRLVWVETDDQIRYERSLKHLREGELAISFEEFKRQENLQWQPQPGIPIEAQMNIAYVKEHATHTLVNNGNDFDEFIQKADALIKELGA